MFAADFITIIGNETTTLDLTVSRTVYVGAGTKFGITVLNLTDRVYTAVAMTGGDGISLQVTKISEGVQTITL